MEGAEKVRKISRHAQYGTYVLLGFLFLGIGLFIFRSWKLEEGRFFAEQIQRTARASHAIFSVYQRASSLIVSTITHNEEIPRIMKEAWENPDPQVRQKLRTELLERLSPLYEEMKKNDFRQLHFHFPDNTSFLRFHRPEKFGDDLTEVRKTVAFTNKSLQETVGFEEGRIFNGYRFVYPLFWKDEHVGSVEASISLFPVVREFSATVERGEIAPVILFLIQRDLVESTVFESDQDHYRISSLSSHYMVDKEFTGQLEDAAMDLEAIDNAVRQVAEKKMPRGEPFIVPCYPHSKGCILVKFLPVRNFENLLVGYVVYYYESPAFTVLKKSYLLRFFYLLLFAGAVFFVVFLRQRYLRQLEKLATVDPLTGAQNRHALVESFNKSLALARRYDRPLSVIMFDVDYFKTVNDVHGHTVGDEVLVKLVDLCRKELRKADHLARWGGDEFFILLPETPGESALEVAERIRHKVPVLFEEKPYTVTLSMGVYQVPVEKISSADQAFAEVDKALYRAKEKGRNRVERA